MILQTQSNPKPSPTELGLKRVSVTLEQYHQMIRAGVLMEGERVELIDGEILEMAAIGSKHSAQVNRFTHIVPLRLAQLNLSSEILMTIQNPVELGPRSEPEPDVALLRWREDFYQGRHPQPADVLLVIEVADSTVVFDQEVKGPLYAISGIEDYWLINLQDDVIEVRREPSAEGYGQVEILQRGEAIAPLAYPQLSFTVDELLG